MCLGRSLGDLQWEEKVEKLRRGDGGLDVQQIFGMRHGMSCPSLLTVIFDNHHLFIKDYIYEVQGGYWFMH